MAEFFPAGPQSVPADLTRPTASYRRHAWFAAAALIGFALLYGSLCTWFVSTGWRLVAGAFTGNHGDRVIAGLVGLCAFVLAFFMLKALVAARRAAAPDGIEITAQDEPRLFEFLQRLAREAGAPQARRVFLTARVNAAVFYDLTLLNLIFPSKKNLEIGLGLVNVLSLSEFKAVLAHEFGHFAQRSMAVGRWVYMAQQIAAGIVAKRDALDRFLEGLSHVDIRIAWIGWILRLIIWSIRSLVESAFQLVVLAQRALSREMEFQADLVAVSLTGSDALIHALHRVEAADEAWDSTLAFANTELGRNRTTADLYAVHARVIELLGEVRGDPHFGRVPPTAAGNDAGSARLFKPELAHPSRMWATHPFNHEREDNAKRVYVPAPRDERSAWALFADPAQTRLRSSQQLVVSAKELPPVAPMETTLGALEGEFRRPYLNPIYHGVYLGRSMVRHAARPDELYETLATATPEMAAQAYPATLADTMEKLRGAARELGLLEALQAGTLKPTEGVIRHRGRALSPKQLPAAIREVQAEKTALEQTLQANDRRVRGIHLALARKLGRGWDAYLMSLLRLVHYGEHVAADLTDLRGVLAAQVAVETATRRVSEKGAARIMHAATNVHSALREIFNQSEAVVLDARTTAALDGKTWHESLGTFDLPAPTYAQLGDWLNVIDGWISHVAGLAQRLARTALDTLLMVENVVARASSAPDAAVDAPAPARTPDLYPTLLPGAERKRESKVSWWARFQSADGLLPGLARLGVAGAIVGSVLGFGAMVGETSVVVYNGLAQPVVVSLGDKTVPVAAFGTASVVTKPDANLHVVTRTQKGTTVETFDIPLDGSISRYVYNVAQAMSFIEWQATYGNATPVPPRDVGAPRWMPVSVDHLFEKPPQSVKTKGGGATRTVLEAPGDIDPRYVMSAVTQPADAPLVLAAHARWDPPETAHLFEWLNLASRLPDFQQVLAARLKEWPDDVAARRLEQDSAGARRDDVCRRHADAATARPTDANWQYLAIRCVPDARARDAAFLKACATWPANGWVANACGYVEAGNQHWAEAQTWFERARTATPALKAFASMESARVLRMKGGQLTPAYARGTTQLEQILSIEQGATDGLNGIYAKLTRGQIEPAMQAAASLPPADRARVVRLAAASDGAPAKLVAEALALPASQGTDADSLFAMLGLVLREGRDSAPVVALLRERVGEEADPVLRFIDAVRAGGDPTRAEPLLDGVQPYTRGHAYSVATIMLGAKAPLRWRLAAQALLFAPERPYFTRS